MDAAFVITWTVPFPGRERQALELAAEAEGYWGVQAADGRCTAPEWFFLPNGSAFWLVKGERPVLQELVTSDTSRHLLAKGSLLLQDWSWSIAETGAGAERLMGDYGSMAEELGVL